MSLQVWLPLLGNLNNQGIQGNTVTSSNYSSASGGKLGTCIKTNANGNIPLGYSSAQCNTGSLSFCGWFKLNKAEIWNTISGLSYTSTNPLIACNIIGNNSYGGVGLWMASNNIYNDGTLNSFTIYSYLRTSANGARSAGGWSIPWDTWFHACLVFNKDTKVLSLYINGLLSHYSTMLDFTDMKNESLAINYAGIAGGNGFGRSIPMLVNDVRVYDHALSTKEVKELAKALVLHYKLDGLTGGNENLILSSQFVSGGGASSGNTRSYASDGSLKVVAASGNGNWVSLSFPQDSNSNIGSKMAVGDAYTISVDVKVEEGTTLPTLFINGGNGYKRLLGTIVLNQWIRAYYSSTWADPGTSYGNISLHLGFSGLVGTYYFKNFKLEKGSTPTTWSPSPLDAGYSTAYFNTVFDSSGLGYNGTLQSGRNLIISSDTKRYDYSTEFPFYSSKTGNYVTMNNSTLFPSLSTCTLCWWGKYNVAKSLLITGQSTSYFVAAGNPSFYNQNANMSKYYVDGVQVSSVPSYVANQWHHYVLVVNLSSWTTMMLNNYGSADTWSINGKISDFRIYAKELTADEVLELYHTEASMDRGGNYYTRELME